MIRALARPALLCALFAAPLSAQGIAPGAYGGPAGMVLTISDAGRYAVQRQGRMLVGGAVRLLEGELVFEDDSGSVACPGAGRYRATIATDTLRLTAVADPCANRLSAFTAQGWVLRRDALALVHATVLDMTGTAARPGMTLVLREGRIAELYPDGTKPVPPDAMVRDVAGGFVLPGLIDAHVHNATSPSTVDRRSAVEARLRLTLLGGVVAVRDMGGDARALADLARAASAGDITAPEIRYSAIMAGPNFFTDARVLASSVGMAPGTAPWARSLTDSTDLRQVVAEARGSGASAIKMYADLGPALAQRATQEARRQGLGVWAHLTTVPARPTDLVRAGVEVVSHALLVPWEVQTLPDWKSRAQVDLSITPDHPAIQRLFAEMKARGTIFDPTLFVYRAESGAPDTGIAKRREARALDIVRAAHQAGVVLSAGTDGMQSERGGLPNLHEELALLVRAGLSPREALVAATRTNAQALGLSSTHGTIAVGKAADLLVLSADPLADIQNTRRIAFVVRRGLVVPN